MVNIDDFDEACFANDLSKVKKLIEDDKSIVNAKDYNNDGWTGLMKAVQRNNTNIVKEILATPEVDLSLTDNSGKTALHLSSEANRLESLKLLLGHPLCSLEFVGMENFEGKTAEMIAVTSKHKECVSEIINFIEHKRNTSNGASVSVSFSKQTLNRMSTGIDFIIACATGNLAQVKTFINDDKNIINEKVLSDGSTGLMMAIRENKPDIVEVILSTPDVEINLTNNRGDTALLISLVSESLESLKLLLRHPQCSPDLVRMENKGGISAESYAPVKVYLT